MNKIKEAVLLTAAILTAAGSTVTAVQTTRMAVNGFEVELTADEADVLKAGEQFEQDLKAEQDETE